MTTEQLFGVYLLIAGIISFVSCYQDTRCGFISSLAFVFGMIVASFALIPLALIFGWK